MSEPSLDLQATSFRMREVRPRTAILPLVPRGNFIAKTAVRQLNYDHLEVDAIWLQPLAVAAAELRNVFGSVADDVHAGEVETSLLLALRPELVKGRGVDHVPAVSRQLTD